jgi:outer membrane protein insertion porin family
LGGDVLVQRSSHTETISLARLARHRAVSPQHLLDETVPSLADRIRLDLTVETVEDLSVDNNYGRFEADASLRVRGTVARPGVIGRVSMREGGVVYLAGRTFQVNVGEATFADPSRVAPELDIEAQAVADGDVLTVRLRGPLEEPKFELSSTNRDKSADQLASDLLGTDLSQMSGEQTGQAAMTLLASDLLGVTGSKVGFDTMRLDRGDPFDMEFRADNMAIGNDADPATRLTVAKRLGDIEVTVSQNLKDSGETTVIISYFLVPAFEIRAISTDDDELGIGVRHQIDFGGAPKPPAARAEREALRVSSVTVLGNPAPLQEAQLRKRLSLDDGDRFDFFDWQRDIDRLRADYMAAGHYEARVRGRRVEDVPGSVGLEYRIQPGPRTELVVQGVELPDDERRAIEVAWTRAVFDRFLLDEIEAIVRRHLIESGHVEGVVESRFDTAAGVKRAVVTVVPGPPVEGREIRFTGNAAIDSSRLAEAVTAANLDVEGWLDPQRLVPVLQDYYRRLGYLSAGVSPGTPRAEDGQGVLPVAIDEGARADVTEVLWTGVDSVRLAAVREAAGLASPLPYDSRRIAEATDRVMRFYRARGFNTASVTPAAEAHADRATITMRIAVEEGPQQILRDVVVTGATRTREGIVSNALRLRVGEPVVFADWASSRKHLYDTNVFRQVQMVAEPMGEPAGGVQPVRARVTVVEHPRWRLRYGLQYETEPSASADAAQAESGFGVSGELRNPNLFGIAVAGGLFARYEREEQAASLFASKATFFGLPLQTSIYSFLARDHFHAPEDDTTSFIVDRIGASLEQRARRGRLGLTYAYQYEIHHLYDPARPEVEFLPHLGARANLGRVSSALMFDRRNDLLNARAGTFSSGSVEHAANWLGSDMKYTKVLVQHHMFTEVRRIVLASRAQVGHTWNPEGLLPFDRFRAGGATTVRGYPQDGLVHFDSNGLPRGGTSLVILNQEVRFPMLRRLGGVAFLDAGNTFDPEHPVEWSELKIGYGLGLRLVLPLGQLRLDFGIPGSSVAALPSVVPNSWASGRWYLGVGQVF